MKAVKAVDRKCVVVEEAIPTVSGDQILIKIHYSALNRADLMQASGRYPPPKGVTDTLGLECAGTVEKVGPDCSKGFATGDKVMALLPGGGYAEFVSVTEAQVMHVPKGFSLRKAAAIPEVWLTAFLMLKLVAKVQSGETVLVHVSLHLCPMVAFYFIVAV